MVVDIPWSLDTSPSGDSEGIYRRRAFNWEEEEGPVTEDGGNGSTIQPDVVTCRNSVQGKALLADDKGYVCPRWARLSNGCCDAAAPATRRHACEACNAQHCCAVYEHCVSCCMQPSQVALLKAVLLSSSSRLLSSVQDQFSLCLVKCRTSSQSVHHETLYRDALKHCYGASEPRGGGDPPD